MYMFYPIAFMLAREGKEEIRLAENLNHLTRQQCYFSD
jgi:hypothetical protein